MKIISFTILFLISLALSAQINNSKIYWVGHSLISHTDNYTTGTTNLVSLMGQMANSQGKTYNFHQHTTPGAPLGWNWGANPTAWSDIQSYIQPLINSSHADYGSFDTIILTEAIDVNSMYDYWSSSFYARKFYLSALHANPNTRLFLYESWHHFQASDDDFRPYYGAIASFDWEQYMLNIRSIWETIIDKANDPSQTQNDASYVYQGTGIDPGLGSEILDIKIIPTGQVLVQVLNRLSQNLASDDWTYNGSNLTALDFFANPLSNFPTDLSTTVHPETLDDIHPTHILIYLNALVHYAVVYQDNPINIPALNSVPSNIADIFKDVVWSVVINDSRTGVADALSITNNTIDSFNIYPNPTKTILHIQSNKTQHYKIINTLGQIVLEGYKKTININQLSKGLYFIKTSSQTKTFVKK
jgi:hypothetical protein